MSPGALSWVFSFTAVGTALVVGASLGLPLLLGAEGGWSSTWPLLGALALAGAGWLQQRRGGAQACGETM